MLKGMIEVPAKQFQKYVDESIESMPEEFRVALKENNVAFFIRDEPSKEQLASGNVQPGYTLLGLYHGVSLVQRQGRESVIPDTITIFQNPHQQRSNSISDLKKSIHDTVRHEIAHFFGLGHDAIAKYK